MANLTLAQMLALLPDNTTGLIDAVNVRDVVQALFERTDETFTFLGVVLRPLRELRSRILDRAHNSAAFLVEDADFGTLTHGMAGRHFP